jgi:purine-binding chemotaxis protein CheW
MSESGGRRLLRFRAAGTACACDLDKVCEIVRGRPLARLPGAPQWVRGIMNLRGTLITVVDLSVRLGATVDGPPRVVMVVEAAGKRFGIGVESVQGVADVDPAALETVDAQRNAGGVVGALAHFGETADETAQWMAVDAIARESLAT